MGVILWKTFFGRKTSWKNADKLAKLVVLRKLIHEWELYKNDSNGFLLIRYLEANPDADLRKGETAGKTGQSDL